MNPIKKLEKVVAYMKEHESFSHDEIFEKVWRKKSENAIINSTACRDWFKDLDDASDLAEFFANLVKRHQRLMREEVDLLKDEERNLNDLERQIEELDDQLDSLRGIVDVKIFIKEAELPSHFDLSLNLHREKFIEALKRIEV